VAVATRRGTFEARGVARLVARARSPSPSAAALSRTPPPSARLLRERCRVLAAWWSRAWRPCPWRSTTARFPPRGGTRPRARPRCSSPGTSTWARGRRARCTAAGGTSGWMASSSRATSRTTSRRATGGTTGPTAVDTRARFGRASGTDRA